MPEDVARLLNVSELNFQHQLDSPYWLMKSAGEVSRELNAVVNLGAIDTALARAASLARQAKAEVEVSEARLREARAARDALEWVPRMRESLVSLLTLETSLGEKRAKIAQAERSLESVGFIARDRDRAATGLLGALERVRGLGVLAERLGEVRGRLERAKKALEAAREAAEWRDSCVTRRDESERTLAGLTRERCPLCGRRSGPSPS